MELVKYEEQYKVESFDGNVHFIPAKAYAEFKKAMNTDRFVEVNGELINTSSIKRVVRSLGEAGLGREQRIALELRKDEFMKRLGRPPTKQELSKLIQKLNPLAS
jgi:hypothetical protein